MALSLNQIKQIPVKGQVDMLSPGQSTLSGQIDVSSGGGLIPGQSVKMVDNAGGVPKFVECAADTDAVFGFINYNLKQRTFAAYDYVEVTALSGGMMWMEASAAIARDAQVMIVVTGSKVATATSGKRIVGHAYDKAAASGDLIRVTVQLPGALA